MHFLDVRDNAEALGIHQYLQENQPSLILFQTDHTMTLSNVLTVWFHRV